MLKLTLDTDGDRLPQAVVLPAPGQRDAMRALATAAGCEILANASVLYDHRNGLVDVVFCSANQWPQWQHWVEATGPKAVLVVTESMENLDPELLTDPWIDDFVTFATPPGELRLRLQRVLGHRQRESAPFDSLSFASGTVDELQPLHGALEALISALEAKDPHTRDHSHRVCATATELAARMLPGDTVFLERIRIASLFHDIGKIGVPEAVLNKSGQLEPDEWAAVQRHVLLGVGILRPIVDTATLAMVRHHHERWDGWGYPDGVSGADIPLGARIIAVADSWDAMTSVRPYRPALPREKVWKILREGAGSQWDPTIVDVFLQGAGMALPRLAA
jgi:HD-GYP domain-containing protein (c-di-GMP phosphodiesterase class II)